jgi:hypothetical protein
VTGSLDVFRLLETDPSKKEDVILVIGGDSFQGLVPSYMAHLLKRAVGNFIVFLYRT